jgi:NAD-dependent DNA ligase
MCYVVCVCVCVCRFVFGLGIPQVGIQTAVLLADVCRDDIHEFMSLLYELRDSTTAVEEVKSDGVAERLRRVNGVGDAVLQALGSLAGTHSPTHSLTHSFSIC